jgi:uncharacterized protein YaeQ
VALTATIYRFQIELSDITRGVYETLDLRVAQHPSEHLPYLLTRVIAFALNYQEGLAFSTTGLSDPDAAAISVPAANGGVELLIEVGSPSARRLHKASKLSPQVKVYTYKNRDQLVKDLREEKIHRLQDIGFFALSPKFLDELGECLKRDNRWGMLVDEGQITLHVGEQSVTGELESFGHLFT